MAVDGASSVIQSTSLERDLAEAVDGEVRFDGDTHRRRQAGEGAADAVELPTRVLRGGGDASRCIGDTSDRGASCVRVRLRLGEAGGCALHLVFDVLERLDSRRQRRGEILTARGRVVERLVNGESLRGDLARDLCARSLVADERASEERLRDLRGRRQVAQLADLDRGIVGTLVDLLELAGNVVLRQEVRARLQHVVIHVRDALLHLRGRFLPLRGECSTEDRQAAEREADRAGHRAGESAEGALHEIAGGGHIARERRRDFAEILPCLVFEFGRRFAGAVALILRDVADRPERLPALCLHRVEGLGELPFDGPRGVARVVGDILELAADDGGRAAGVRAEIVERAGELVDGRRPVAQAADEIAHVGEKRDLDSH